MIPLDLILPVAALTAVLAAAPATQAHVSLETKEATAGSTYKAVLRVPHGCNGSPTVAIRLRIPEGVTGVKPMPKPGWQLATVMDGQVDHHGDSVSSAVREITWTGGRLLDGH